MFKSKPDLSHGIAKVNLDALEKKLSGMVNNECNCFKMDHCCILVKKVSTHKEDVYILNNIQAFSGIEDFIDYIDARF